MLPLSALTKTLATTLALQTPQSTPRQVTLEKPDAILDVDFTQIRGVRELRDGRVLVSDRLDRGVVVATFGTNAVKPVGRTGRGPSEYRLPTALIPLPGDSTLLFDEGNSRLAIIGPDLRIHRSFNVMLPRMGTPVSSRTIDTRGRFYLSIPSWMLPAPGGKPRDTIPIVRYDPNANRVDTITSIRGMSNRAPGPRLVPGVPYIVFAPQDVWAVNAAGRIAIVRSNDYHVEWYEPGGRVVRGPRVAHDPLPVTPQDRIVYMRNFMQNANSSGRDPDGGMSATPAEETTDAALRVIVEGNEFALTKPATTDNSPLMSPEGTLWVERYVRLGDAPMWDVFDGAGVLVGRVRLPRGQRVVSLGSGAAYAVMTDEDGLQKLVRYRRDKGL